MGFFSFFKFTMVLISVLYKSTQSCAFVSSVMVHKPLERVVNLIEELEKNFGAAVDGIFDLDEIRKKLDRTDKEAPEVTQGPKTKVMTEVFVKSKSNKMLRIDRRQKSPSSRCGKNNSFLAAPRLNGLNAISKLFATF